MGADYEIRPLESGDVDSLLSAFNVVFSKGDPDHVPRTREEWSWSFERNPAGRRVYVAVSEGEVVAQYAALPARAWIGGEERIFAQIVDSMVHPAHRGGSRPSLFVRTARPFFEEFGRPGADLVHYGWPVPRAWSVGRRELAYEAVRTQSVLVQEIDRAPEAGEVAGVEVLDRVDEQVRWLYDRCVGAFGASLVRDAEYVRWRYLEHPRHRYVLLGARDAEGILRGLLVYRFGRFLQPDLGLLVDWLVPPEEPEVGELLLRAARTRAAREGAAALVAWIPDWSPWFGGFQAHGFRVHPGQYLTVARSFDPRYGVSWLRDNWWYQLGDSDLV